MHKNNRSLYDSVINLQGCEKQNIFMAVIRILVPTNQDVSLDNTNVYYKGYMHGSAQSSLSIYLTKCCSKSEILEAEPKKDGNCVYGYSGDGVPKEINKLLLNFIYLNQECTQVEKLFVNGQIIPTRNIIIMYYDYYKLQESETITGSFDIEHMQSYIHHQNGQTFSKTSNVSSLALPHWLSSSMFLQHICNYLNLVKWLITTILIEKKISIKQGNLILAMCTDVMLGYVLLQMLPDNTGEIRVCVVDMLEKLINMLYSLLTWLMGAPVGLKLNNAFNKMLGKYFSYHVQLWWLFLDTCSTNLDVILNVYHHIGYLGLTFQIAILSDTICIATFHSYCIYVYAARLFNIQISGLIALLRLFVGRKYNPLRGGIDSCEYTNQELFVGTVAFTILLLLLPTTTMYYIVFTVFRVLSLTIQHILAKLIYIVQTLPLYVTALWLTKSHKVTGNIRLKVKSSEPLLLRPLIVRIELLSKSLFELVKQFKPPVEVPRHVEWTNLLSNVLVGKQIV